MNKIYDVIHKIHMDEEKKQSIRTNIMKEYKKVDEQPVKMRKRASWRTVAAAMAGVLVLLGGSSVIVGAGVHFDLNKEFQAYFGLSEQEEKELQEENVIQCPKISDIQNGVTVEAEKVISTGAQCFVLLKITAPESMWPLDNPMHFDNYDICQNGKPVEGYSNSYLYNGQEPSDSDKAWNTIVWHPEKGITYEQFTLDKAEGQDTWDGSTIQMKISGLRYSDDSESGYTDVDTDSIWNLEIPVASSDKTVEYDMLYSCQLTDEIGIESTGLESILITKVTLNPFGINVKFKCPEKWQNDPGTIGIIGNVTAYEKKDGSIVKFDIEEDSYPNIEINEDGTCEMCDMYELMDVEDIVAIYLDEQRIPLK